ncbi:MAG: GspH/FimT family pseudopilin [Pseudohongiellaceae bacterium]|nr:GspH/FimT family pseudopilin [Pseudohongiellaceae bacterium]
MNNTLTLLKNSRGVTLLELLISVSVMAIIVSLAAPNFSQFGMDQRLIGAAEQVYEHMQQARTEAVTRSTATYLNFSANGTTNWTYGMSSVTSLCNVAITDPTTANACVMVIDDGDGVVDPGDGSVDTGDLVLYRYNGAEYTDVAMTTSLFSSGTTEIVYDPIRGMSSSARVLLTGGNGNSLRVAISLLGRVTICSPGGTVDNYGAC